MKELLESIRKKAMEEIAQSEDPEALRIRYLGKKGELTAVLRGMGSVPPEERPVIGALANDIREQIEAALAAKAEEKKEKELAHKLEAEALDVTIPGTACAVGRRHPLAQTENMLRDIFIGMGFSVAEGPEVEYDYYNFEALNLPKNHPARDTQDTFYITDNILLRSQTSPVQVRTMEVQKPPIRVISPGRVYRADPADATHSPIFYQVEGLVVDKGITMGDLKGILELFAKRMFSITNWTILSPRKLCYNRMIEQDQAGSVKPYGTRTGKGNQTAFHQGGPAEILPAGTGEGKDHSRQPPYPGSVEPVQGYPGWETDPNRHGVPDPPDQRQGL